MIAEQAVSEKREPLIVRIRSGWAGHRTIDSLILSESSPAGHTAPSIIPVFPRSACRQGWSSQPVDPGAPFEEWPSVFRNDRLIGTLLDRLTRHVHIFEMNGESYRLRQLMGRRKNWTGRSRIAGSASSTTSAIF